MRYDRLARKGKQCAREGLAVEGLYRDTNGRIVTGTRLGLWVVSRYRRDTVGGSAAIRRRERTGVRCDTATQACDTARPGLRHGAVCAQAGQGVHLVHPTSFGLSALFLSHCLGHCS